MKLLIDMNLSPLWVDLLQRHGFEALHWAQVGDPRAPDTEIMAWARDHGYIVFTHDLDFTRLLALTRAHGPSVLQIRTEDVLPSSVGALVLATLDEHGELLRKGALIVVNAEMSRARVLPF